MKGKYNTSDTKKNCDFFRWCFTPNDDDKSATLNHFGDNLIVPNNFEKTAEGFSGYNTSNNVKQPEAVSNPQTVLFCQKLLIDDPLNLILKLDTSASSISLGADSANTTFIDSDVTIVSPQKKIVLDLPEPVSSNVSFEENFSFREDKQPEMEEETNIEEVSNVTTKFKRRNASMYGNNDVDN